MAQNEPYLHPMSATARAGNAALLIAGMIVLFFQISVLLLTGPNLWQHSTLSQTEAYLASSMVFFGIGGGLLSFWWKTRPVEGDG